MIYLYCVIVQYRPQSRRDIVIVIPKGVLNERTDI